ncbi:ribonuclease H-like domain-containing protein [Tanacetum coccineum]
MAGSDDEIPPPPPPPQTPTQQAPHTVSTIKLPILKKGEYDIWAMKMEHYLSHTDYPIWEVIQKGNGPVSVSTDTNGVIKVLPPKTAEEILARERERKARTTLLMALPEDHLAKFHKMTDAKDMWDAIKSRFGGNDESKKMQKYILKQQFEGFSVSNSEGLHKGYDRFQSLLSQLEIHGAGVSTEDANQKFLRSLPSSWSQVSLVMRTKPGVDSLSIDDLYNNLRVFESDVKGSTGSSSSAQNVAFVSSESTSSTNDVSTAYGVSTSSGYNSQRENSSSYTDELMYSFFANQSSGPQLDHEDLEQLDEFDLEEMDLKWQVAMISMRLKKFYKKTGRRLQFDAKEPVGFDKTKVECFNCHKTGHFARECRSKGNQESRRRDAGNTGYKAKDNGRRPGKQEEPKALVTLDGEGVDWTGHAEDEQENFALMAYSNSGSDTEVTSCSKECVESYAKLKKLYDEQKEQLSDASVMSSPNHPTSDIEDAFSSNFSDYIPASPDYFPASPGNTSSESSNNSSKTSTTKDNVIRLNQPIPISPSSSVGSSSPVRSTTPPPDYPFDESIFAELDNSLWIIPRPLGGESVPEESNEFRGGCWDLSAGLNAKLISVFSIAIFPKHCRLRDEAATFISYTFAIDQISPVKYTSMENRNHIRTLGDYFRPATKATGTPLSSPKGTMWYLSDPTPSGWFKTDAHSTDLVRNWLERLSAGSISTWEDLTTRFLAQFFPPGRTAILKDLALYDNESWNDPRDFAKPVKAISLPQDVLSTSDHHLIELENQVQCLMKAHLAPTQNVQQAFVDYTSSRTDEAGEGLVSNFMASQDARLSKFEADFKQQQSEMTNKIDSVLKAITDRIAGALPSDTVKNPKLSTSPVLSARSYPTMDPQCSTQIHSSINAITIHPEQQSNSRNDRTKENEEEEKDSLENTHFDSSTPPDPSISFITEKVLKFNSLF